MNETKCYLLTQPSCRGMGSDSDYALVTEENLHKIMSEEEIEEKLKKCSTYDEVPDLVALPNDIPVTIKNMQMKKTIFRVHNQWGYERDIIVGDASFTRYFVDLSNCDRNLGRWFREKTIYEFTSFDFRRTLENHFFLFYKAEDLVRNEKDKIERINNRENFNMDIIKNAEAAIKHFDNLPKLIDEYYEHFYHQKYSAYRDFMKEIVDDEIKQDDVDHTLCAYSRCLLPLQFACEIGQHEEYPHDFRYDELFVRGADIRHLIADLIGSREELGGFENPQIDLALLTVFGYD